MYRLIMENLRQGSLQQKTKRIQLLEQKVTSSFKSAVSHNVMTPPEAPMELIAIPSQFRSAFFPICAVFDSFILVSWRRITEGFSDLNRSLRASILALLTKPLQF
jgi:hypothetical protein